MGYSNDLQVRVSGWLRVGVGTGCGATVRDRKFDGGSVGEAMAGDRQRRSEIEQGAKPVTSQAPKSGCWSWCGANAT
jgi:hypothetical protein